MSASEAADEGSRTRGAALQKKVGGIREGSSRTPVRKTAQCRPVTKEIREETGGGSGRQVHGGVFKRSPVHVHALGRNGCLLPLHIYYSCS